MQTMKTVVYSSVLTWWNACNDQMENAYRLYEQNLVPYKMVGTAQQKVRFSVFIQTKLTSFPNWLSGLKNCGIALCAVCRNAWFFFLGHSKNFQKSKLNINLILFIFLFIFSHIIPKWNRQPGGNLDKQFKLK